MNSLLEDFSDKVSVGENTDGVVGDLINNYQPVHVIQQHSREGITQQGFTMANEWCILIVKIQSK